MRQLLTIGYKCNFILVTYIHTIAYTGLELFPFLGRTKKSFDASVYLICMCFPVFWVIKLLNIQRFGNLGLPIVVTCTVLLFKRIPLLGLKHRVETVVGKKIFQSF